MLAGKKNTLRANTKNPGNNFPIPHENSGLQNCHETSRKQLCDGGVGGGLLIYSRTAGFVGKSEASISMSSSRRVSLSVPGLICIHVTGQQP